MDNNIPLDELRKKIIKIGFVGIFVFALAIAGAAASHYFADMPNYANLRKGLLIFSLIDFIFGISILLVFRKHIISYKDRKDKQNEFPD